MKAQLQVEDTCAFVLICNHVVYYTYVLLTIDCCNNWLCIHVTFCIPMIVAK